MPGKLGLLERLERGPLLCAEGYLYELERRGYVQAGCYVPEVVLEHPEVVAQLHRDFVHAGSDVVEAFTYYGHRARLRQFGKEHLLEALNRNALAIAKEVAEESGALLAGNICNTNVFDPSSRESRDMVRSMFDEQVAWAVEAGVDYIIAETLYWVEEAEIALAAIRAAGVPAVVTLVIGRKPETLDGVGVAEACQRLEAGGAAVVGLNCIRGPGTTLPLLAEIRKAVQCWVAGLPVPYRTTEHEPTMTMFPFRVPDSTDGTPRRTAGALEPFLCTRYETAEFAHAATELGIRYLGLCCGAGPHHIRSMAEALGRTPPASRYSPNVSAGEDPALSRLIRERF